MTRRTLRAAPRAILLALTALSALSANASTYSFRTPSKGVAPVVPPVSIQLVNGARQYSDGEVAPSCAAYLHPTDGHTYTGNTGDGLYWIKPTAAAAAFKTTCDMTLDGGGWTLIGTFNGSTDTTLSLANRNSIPYTQAKLTLDGKTTVKVIKCYANPTTGFAADTSKGINCTTPDTDGNTYSIRVLQAGAGTGGNYGFYTNGMSDLGGCSWYSTALVWGRHFSGIGGSCQTYGNGQTFSSGAGWGSSSDWLYVR